VFVVVVVVVWCWGAALTVVLLVHSAGLSLGSHRRSLDVVDGRTNAPIALGGSLDEHDQVALHTERV